MTATVNNAVEYGNFRIKLKNVSALIKCFLEAINKKKSFLLIIFW